MKLRTEDALGYFSAQMLGQIALPSVTSEAQRLLLSGSAGGKSAARALAKQMNRVPVDGTDSAPGQPAADTKRDPAPTPKTQDRLDTAEASFAERLGVCGCGSPDEAMRALLQVLGGLHTRRWPVVSELSAEGLYMLALYLLDEKDLVEHGGSLHGAWLTRKGLDLLGWLEQQQEALADRIPPLAMKTCGSCTSVVLPGDWSYLFDSCSECAENAARTGDNWRDFVREQDRLRIIGEFTD